MSLTWKLLWSYTEYRISQIALAPRELLFWGPHINQRNEHTAYADHGTVSNSFIVILATEGLFGHVIGASMLEIAVGHQMGVFTYLLGDFESVSATITTKYPTATLYDDGKPTDKTITVTVPDHVAFTGVLKSGAVSSVTWRGGLKSTTGRKQFIWEIDGEEGSIRLESDSVGGAFLHIRDPQLYLNGQLVEVQNAAGPADNLATAWAEFAKGEQGQYPTIDDAVKNQRLLDAISKSAKEGKTVYLE